MLNHMRACLSWLDWKLGAVVMLVVAGLALCFGLSGFHFMVGMTPLLLLAVCLLPCLLPFAFWRRNKR